MKLKNVPNFGDIFEIRTPSGLGYGQYTHDGPSMGQLVRVLPGLFSSRPTDFAALANKKELYFVFYTLKHAVRAREAEIVYNQPIPEWAKPYPLMRWPGLDYGTWKIFSASDALTLEMHRRTPLILQLTPEQEKLSIHMFWPHPVMVKEMARGWMPERDAEFRSKDTAEAAERKRAQTSKGDSSQPAMKHFLYFSKKRDAETAGEELRTRGFIVDVRKGADGRDWLALATRAQPTTAEKIDEIRDEMTTLASRLHGEYDGWEMAVGSDGSNFPTPRSAIN